MNFCTFTQLHDVKQLAKYNFLFLVILHLVDTYNLHNIMMTYIIL